MLALGKIASSCIVALALALAAHAPATAQSGKKAASSTKASKPSKSVRAVAKPTARPVAQVRRIHRVTSVRHSPAPLRRAAVAVEAPRPSFGQLYGLHQTADALDLKSSVALVLDQDTNEVLLSKNPQAVLPIASITKLMTALVVLDARLPFEEILTVTDEDIDTEKGSRSRLRVGTQLSRGEMLHLALMSSENRAANALGRHYPGGLAAFVVAMNVKARELRMADTRFQEPTGLSSQNQSSARDLATLVSAAYRHQAIRDLSTSPGFEVAVGNQHLQYRTTNTLVLNPEWEIGLQKTGYISEAGRCLVMQAQLAGRKLIMVFLDSAGKYSRLGDAERVRRWLTEAAPLSHAVLPVSASTRGPVSHH